MRYQDPFEHSAKIYDLTSRYVPYDMWANFIFDITERHSKLKNQIVIELSAGTGSFRTYFHLPHVKHYFCSDISLNMLKGAKLKFEDCEIESNLFCQDNLNFAFKSNSVDLVILLFDSINYMTEPDKIVKVLNQVSDVLKTNGLFIFDFTTPNNSIENMPEDFEENFEEINSSFTRLSKYNPETQIHITEFELLHGKDKIVESHIERPYHFAEMKEMISQVKSLKPEAFYDEFDMVTATDKSQRIHSVLRKRGK